jgi:radical SAM superfamily enzyme YgiQ (UPF0313 family)
MAIDIIFINPPLTSRQKYGELSEAGAAEPPLGLCYLSAIVRKHGLSVRIIDGEAQKLSVASIVNKIAEQRPKYVGITATTISILAAHEIAQGIKDLRPETITIIGGPHVTSLPEKTMNDFNSFDYAVIGEGEQTIIELLNAISRGKGLNNINGIVFRESGKCVITKSREFIHDLDTLPLPAWDLLPSPFSKYYSIPPQSLKKYPSFSLVTSRGCVGRCIFCDKSVFGNKIRAHGAEYVMQMMEDLYYNYGIRDIHFEDDNFLIFKKRNTQLAEMLKERRLDLVWSCLGRVDDKIDIGMLSYLKDAGCWQLLFGVESGSQRILDKIQKRVTIHQIYNALNTAKRVGINTKAFIMFGHPTESIESLDATIEFLKKAPLDDFSATFFTPFPGSPVYKEIHLYGEFNEDWTKMNFYEPLFIPDGLSRDILKSYERKAYKTFYLRPKILLRYMSRMRNPQQMCRLVKGAMSLGRYLMKSR